LLRPHVLILMVPFAWRDSQDAWMGGAELAEERATVPYCRNRAVA
jgi:hypothetical protein